jgi:hypothetical protein
MKKPSLSIAGWLVLSLSIMFSACQSFEQRQPDFDQSVAEEEIHTLLDNWHLAATETDFEGYFSKMTPAGIFMGTDATEYWTVTEFKVWAKPYFDNGKAWSFTAHNRHIYFSDDGKTAWFDEELKTPNLGPSRGSGVLSYSESEESWKIAHYNLAIPVPNEIVDSVVTQIEEFHSNQD